MITVRLRLLKDRKVEMGMVVARYLLAPNLLELIFSKKHKLGQVPKSEKGC